MFFCVALFYLLKIAIKVTTIPIIPTMTTQGNQSGEVTHHQDQSIASVNLRTKNIKNNTVVNENEHPNFSLFSIFI